MPSKSRWRDPKAQHFQLVHRSQRDPLIHDPEAGDRVLKQVERANIARSQAKGKSRADLESELPALAVQASKRGNIGEASNYGIYFDDIEYDYMQHLRPIGAGGSGNLPSNAARGGKDEEQDVDAILLQAPKQKNLTKGETPSFALKEDAPSTASHDASSSKLQLPASVFPSQNELPFSYTSHMPIEPSLQGFQPDMNPHLRQTLEALDDDAFVDEGLEDDFFDSIITDGQGADDDAGAEEWMNLPPEGDERIWGDEAKELAERGKAVDESELTLEQRVALFKLKAKMEPAPTSMPIQTTRAHPAEKDEVDEAGDELASLPSGSGAGKRRTANRPASSVGGASSIFGESKNRSRPGVKARYAASDAGKSAFSMSSSAMFRNKGLSGLDEHFDQIERLYGQRSTDDDGEDMFHEQEWEEDDDDEEAARDLAQSTVAIGEDGEPISREDFDGIMDEFLNDYEVLGGKMRQTLGGANATPAEKLDLVRRALGEAKLRDVAEDEEEEPMPEIRVVGSNREKWDVESILSTRTNLENHPRTIRAEDSISIAPTGSMAARSAYMPASIGGGGASTSGHANGTANLVAADKVPKIKIDPRTGIPKIVGYRTVGKKKGSPSEFGSEANAASSQEQREDQGNSQDEGSDYDSDATEGLCRDTITRPRDETAEEKKSRKGAAKEAKQARRMQKSMTKQAFAKERKKQTKETQARVKDGGAADVGRNGIAAGVLRL
ncbi:hypothetical protein K437DRAFT_240396 [Tilletiaria anomala UBC 951]|uniref:LTV-domain-containing protein n=1 Tax=Tilletiaria anomala (strain ATCC 24038 / CBS 436.72 / UBC 951) TaxID=1037660 RepID=A0A066V910_TILAU|nr:uncharacterized protein K437DRAFT_240396 [Tilletiaria anomala UBC 951]KDN37946.1 hypothetical protein K437DRAFT_240396 [Tilletiaria anomala UBC 951]